MTRAHNDANVLALGSRCTGVEVAKEIVDVFMSETFSNTTHNTNRIQKLHQIEDK